ncbi:tetratricopeptide repeat protein, partial [Arthrospira platensis SPKY1]|nr:tetratricopeptide repeat protein [Arthrospira platensis SPKY1]
STYHQLGIVAQAQRQWAPAERYYQQALQIYIDFNDRYEQAGTYHQLGRVAEEREQWQSAVGYFFNALETYVAYQDEHNRNIVLRGLGRVWQATQDAALPARVAAILGVSQSEARELLAGGGATAN